MKLESVMTVCDSLNSAGVRYLLVGGIAVIAHGYTRLTMDIDMVISLEETNIRAALAVFRRLGYRPRLPVNPDDFADIDIRNVWIHEKNMRVFSLIHTDDSFPMMDLFVEEPFDFNTEYDQADAFELSGNIQVPVVRLETLIRMKELAGRDKDRMDVENLRYLLEADESEEI
ncbi:MAG TPA: hypothetical protein PLV45_11795 [bacterium]|nr:hypothetical protein [bacterium]